MRSPLYGQRRCRVFREGEWWWAEFPSGYRENWRRWEDAFAYAVTIMYRMSQ